MFDINVIGGVLVVIAEGILFIWFLHKLLKISLKKS